MTQGKKDIWDTLQAIPNFALYVGAFFILSVALLIPPVPLAIRPWTQAVYNYVQDMKSDPIVMYDIGNDYPYSILHLPCVLVVVGHLVEAKHAKFIFVGSIEDTQLTITRQVLPLLLAGPFKNFEYGKDYVVIGFIPGGETGIAGLAANLKTMGKDLYGTPLNDLSLMKNLTDATSIDLWLHVGYREAWAIRQVYAKYKTPIILLGHSGHFVTGPMYMGAGQIVGFLAAWQGAAEYEKLRDQPGIGTTGSVAISVSSFQVIGAAILGNIAYIGARYLRKKEKET